eukprot:CAMPEP_0185581126 /NCGR_PEP_ID=MMETSP0434-20130131/18116_1 /TAXON_ID=626734 ORGANISM="Favella taraikaensis, Strain Fe Narragansett Bay" /NCGR_SAMPLE_ID=MMETSP0434 /ASSEMBLY_ACC=CAM_ASM_000379 /LENGTH=161 /DNA_ID=CAMNT_0028199589 /DNA_START=840 /DNA_END=1326 /DNA_ORIENTATION=+
MKATRYVRRSRIKIGFVGKSVKFPIHFAGHNPLEKVFAKICSIEESRELSKHSSNEDLNKFANQAAAAHNHEAVNSDAGTSEQGCRENNSSGSAQQRPSVDPIIAELDMLDEKLSEGEGSMKKYVVAADTTTRAAGKSLAATRVPPKQIRRKDLPAASSDN